MNCLLRVVVSVLMLAYCGLALAAPVTINKYSLDLMYPGDRAVLTSFQLGTGLGLDSLGEAISSVTYRDGDPQRSVHFSQESFLSNDLLQNRQGSPFLLATANFKANTDTALRGYFGIGNAIVFSGAGRELSGFDELLVVGLFDQAVDLTSADSIRQAVAAVGANGAIDKATIIFQTFDAASVLAGDEFTSNVYLLPGVQPNSNEVPTPSTLVLALTAVVVLSVRFKKMCATSGHRSV